MIISFVKILLPIQTVFTHNDILSQTSAKVIYICPNISDGLNSITCELLPGRCSRQSCLSQIRSCNRCSEIWMFVVHRNPLSLNIKFNDTACFIQLHQLHNLLKITILDAKNSYDVV